MIKMIFCVRRRGDISEANFHDYWLNEHGPLVRSHAKALGIKRYVQTHAIDMPANEAVRAVRGAPERFDGVAELWWDTQEDLDAAGSTPEGQAAGAALLEDEAKFIDFTRSPLWFNQEHVIFGD